MLLYLQLYGSNAARPTQKQFSQLYVLEIVKTFLERGLFLWGGSASGLNPECMRNAGDKDGTIPRSEASGRRMTARVN